MHLRLILAALTFALLLAACASDALTADLEEPAEAATPTGSEGTAAPQPPAATDLSGRIAEAGSGRRPVTLAFAGDVHAERQISELLAQGDNPLAGVAPIFERADVTVVNLETAVGESGQPAEKSYTFLAAPSLWSALTEAGVDVVSLANNHSLDFGAELLPVMLADARRHGLHPVGAGIDADEAYDAALFEVDGRTIAVIGLTRVIPEVEWGATPYRAGLASAYDDQVATAAVERAAAVADHVVVTVHWGHEGADCIDEHQARLGDRLVAAGADVVAGHHPHVLQGIVTRDRSLIAYSLGNFVWYHQGQVGRLTGVLLVTLDDGGVAEWELVPAVIGSTGVPAPATGADETAIRQRVSRLSASPGPCPDEPAASDDEPDEDDPAGGGTERGTDDP